MIVCSTRALSRGCCLLPMPLGGGSVGVADLETSFVSDEQGFGSRLCFVFRELSLAASICFLNSEFRTFCGIVKRCRRGHRVDK